MQQHQALDKCQPDARAQVRILVHRIHFIESLEHTADGLAWNTYARISHDDGKNLVICLAHRIAVFVLGMEIFPALHFYKDASVLPGVFEGIVQ